jgi:hypothetical protein
MAEVFSGLGVPKWWRSEAGLWLPSSISDLLVQNPPGTPKPRFDALLYAERTRPLGNVGVYATPSAVGVAPVPFQEFIATLASVPLGMILPVLCEVQRVLHRRGMDPDVQLALAAGFFSGTPAFEPLARWVNSVRGERVAFCEQRLPSCSCSRSSSARKSLPTSRAMNTRPDPGFDVLRTAVPRGPRHIA